MNIDTLHEQRLSLLRTSGNKITDAHKTILNVLEGLKGHPTSAQIVEAVRQHDQRIGRASVFRTLDLFCQLGILRPIYHEGGGARYVLMPDGHHHHVVCLNCHCTIEFEDCALDGLAHQLETRLKVQLLGHLLEFYGYCEQCSSLPNK